MSRSERFPGTPCVSIFAGADMMLSSTLDSSCALAGEVATSAGAFETRSCFGSLVRTIFAFLPSQLKVISSPGRQPDSRNFSTGTVRIAGARGPESLLIRGMTRQCASCPKNLAFAPLAAPLAAP